MPQLDIYTFPTQLYFFALFLILLFFFSFFFLGRLFFLYEYFFRYNSTIKSQRKMSNFLFFTFQKQTTGSLSDLHSLLKFKALK